MQDASLFLDADIQMDIGIFRQSRRRITGHGNQPVTIGMDERHDFEHFVRLARIRQRQHDIFVRNHTQIAMKSLTRMQEEARSTGRRQRSRNLTPDMDPIFPYP